MTTKQNKYNSDLLEIKTFISDRFDELKSELKLGLQLLSLSQVLLVLSWAGSPEVVKAID